MGFSFGDATRSPAIKNELGKNWGDAYGWLVWLQKTAMSDRHSNL
ncbi:hypothetical protein [Nostoc sp. NMS7]|nr:hypothetical protein [Nostoc sp. NMS7]